MTRAALFAPCRLYPGAIPRALALVVLCSVLVVPRLAKCDVITFNDSGETISVSVPASRIPSGSGSLSCPNPANTIEEECELFLAPPSVGATISSTTLSQFTFIAEDSAGVNASDFLLAETVKNSPDFLVDFVSLEDPIFETCPVPAGCSILENGSVQTLGTITWSDGTVDQIKFQSNVEASAVPEPSSLLLLVAGLMGAAGATRRRFWGLS